MSNRANAGVILSCLVALLVPAAPLARADKPFLLALGDLPGGELSSLGEAASGDGLVIVGTGATIGYIPNCAFRWTRTGGMIGLGDMDGGKPPGSEAWAVSCSGDVVVGEAAHHGVMEAFRWTSNGGMVGLGFLPGREGYSRARGVSDDGQVVVGFSTANGENDPTEAFRWTETDGMCSLGAWPDGLLADVAYGANSDGSVVVGGNGRPFRWTADGGLEDICCLPGGTFAFALAVSADGNVVVGYGNIREAGRLRGAAFRWTPDDGMVSLGKLPGSQWGGLAFSVSGDGNTIVGDTVTADGKQVAMIWDAEHGMRDLHALLADEYGFDLGHWRRLMDAYGISGDGRTITGYGINVDGKTEAWVAHIGKIAPGDANCDHVVDFNDIDAFVLALTDPDEYDNQYGQTCDRKYADVNGDGVVDFNDIDPFVVLLTK